MITNIGAVLTLEEVIVIQNFIASTFSLDGPLTKEKIIAMQKSGIWDIYQSLRSAPSMYSRLEGISK